MKSTLLIRADANSVIGSGHVMRMIALGQLWRDRVGKVIFITKAPNVLLARLAQEGFDVVCGGRDDVRPENVVAERAEHDQAAWVVFDGYQFTRADIHPVRAAGFRVLFLDDHGHQDSYEADLILNQSTCRFDAKYAAGAVNKVLSGPKYALLRQEFLRYPQVCRESAPPPLRILITLGGADPANDTLRLLQQLAGCSVSGMRFIVLLGALNEHGGEIAEFCEKSALPVEFRRNIDNMAQFLSTSVDAALSAGGSTAYELAYAGLPIALVQTAENQRDVIDTFMEHQAAFLLDMERLPEACRDLVRFWRDRSEMDRCGCRAMRLADGLGAKRVTYELRSGMIRLCAASKEDARAIWIWRNAPEVRRFSRQKEMIPFEEHVEWLERVLQNPRRKVLVGHCEDSAIGVVRFDCDPDESVAEISIYLVPERMNQGWGTPLLMAAVRWCWEQTPIRLIKAIVTLDNEVSRRMFERVGFTATDQECYQIRKVPKDGPLAL